MPHSLMEEVIQTFKDIQVGCYDGELSADTTLFDDMQMDDLDMSELVIELEMHFDLHFYDSDLEKVKTIGDVVSLIQRMRDVSSLRSK